MPKSLYDRSLDTVEPRPELDDDKAECSGCGEVFYQEEFDVCDKCKVFACPSCFDSEEHGCGEKEGE